MLPNRCGGNGMEIDATGIPAIALANQIGWAPFRLHVDPPDIFAEEPYADKLHAAKEKHGDKERGIARNRISGEDRADNDVERVEKRDQGACRAEISPHFQRQGRETGEAFEREIP